MKKFNIKCKFVEGQDPKAIDTTIDDKTYAIYIKTIGNLHFSIPTWLQFPKWPMDAGIPLVVDNAFHSCTKGLVAMARVWVKSLSIVTSQQVTRSQALQNLLMDTIECESRNV